MITSISLVAGSLHMTGSFIFVCLWKQSEKYDRTDERYTFAANSRSSIFD